MSIKDVFLNNVELSNLYTNCIKGIISKNDLAETQKAQLIEFSKQQEFKAIELINNLCIANPGTTFEYWEQRHSNYKDAKGVLNWLKSEPIEKQKPKRNELKILFKNSETIDKIHSELKGYFPNKEAELLKALQGEQLDEMLLFHNNQNKFVEVFRRLKYNGFLLNNDTETKNWICTTFQFVKKRFAEPQPFKESSVWDNLNKGKGEPTKKERICNTDWLPYKSPLQLTRETENEKL
jgi:hypothetical protein